MTAKELYAKGYALPGFGMYDHYWQHWDEVIKLPHGIVPVIEIDGWPCAKIEDVRKAAA